jgi:hypothetical protein
VVVAKVVQECQSYPIGVRSKLEGRENNRRWGKHERTIRLYSTHLTQRNRLWLQAGLVLMCALEWNLK